MAASVEAYEERPRRRRGRGFLIGLLVFVIVLAGLLVLADRVGASVAEREIADRVTQQLAQQQVTSAPPEVTVAGVPFLTQVLAGRYERVSIRLRDVTGPVQGETVSVPQMDIDARDVTASLDTLRSGQGDVVAGSVEGRATIAYDSVAALMNQPGVQLRHTDGELQVTAPLSVAGLRLTVNGVANLTVDQGQVNIRFADLTAAGIPAIPAAQAIISAYAETLSIRVALPALPFGLTVQEVQPTADGLVVLATAADVPLNEATA